MKTPEKTREETDAVTLRMLREPPELSTAEPAEALDDAFRKLTRSEGADLIVSNRSRHRLMVDGVTVEYLDAGGSIRGAQARVIDFDDRAANDWLAVNRFSVVDNVVSAQVHVNEANVKRAEASGRSQNKHSRRPDVVLFVNGLPLGVLELKNAATENVTFWSSFQQLQTYQAELPTLFALNALLAVSDGVAARVGTLGAGREWFKPWRTVKKMAGYHQFHMVQVAVGETLRAAQLQRGMHQAQAEEGRYEAGRQPGGKPGDLLRQPLSVAADGVVFSTIHKFFPEEKGDRHATLPERRNIVVKSDGLTLLQFSKSSFRPVRPVAPAALVMHTSARVLRPMRLKVVEHEHESGPRLPCARLCYRDPSPANCT